MDPSERINRFMRAVRLLVSIVCSLILVTGIPEVGMAAGDPPDYTDEQIQDLIEYAFQELPLLVASAEEQPITGDPSVDDRIWELALRRGYEMQPSAENGALVPHDGVLMQMLTATAWADLQDAAAAAGHEIAITSAHRSFVEQREIFLSRLEGTSDGEIDRSLAVAAPPGASRHHSGYTLDIREVDDIFGDFGATQSYQWLAADNYYNAKRFGFLPSYPPSISDSGPDPEAWEWVYVGEDVIVHDGPFFDVLPNHLFVASVEWMSTRGITKGCSPDGLYFCPDLTVDRGQMAAFLRRALEVSAPDIDYFDDDETSIFETDINAIADLGISKGCNPPTNTRYCPEFDLDRGALAAFLTRAFDLPRTEIDYFEDDDGSVFESAINALAESGITKGCGTRRYCPLEPVSRGELAAMLHRARGLLP